MTRLQSFDYEASRGKFTSWLRTLVRNNAADLSRIAGRQRAGSLDRPTTDAHPPAPQPTPMDALARKLDAQQVQQAVRYLRERLSVNSAELAKLRCVAQRPIAEVKAKLGMTSNEIWPREQRLRGHSAAC